MPLSEVVTLAGASIFIGILVQVIKTTLAWGEATVKRFTPLLSVSLGIVAIVLLSAAQGLISDVQTFATAIVLGIFAGASSSGLYDNVKALTAGPAVDGRG